MLLLLTSTIFAQVGVGTTSPLASSALDVTASNKGLLVPRVALTGSADTVTITSPATSLLVYNNATAGTSPNNVTPGYYYYTGSKWERLTNGGANSVGAFTTATANGATITGGVLQLAPASVDYGGVVTNSTQTIAGTKTFSVDAVVNGLTVGKGLGNNETNTALGNGSLAVVTPLSPAATNGINNTAVGKSTLKLTTTGDNNTAIGNSALAANTTGGANVALGSEALNAMVSGGGHIAIGYQTLKNSIAGYENTAVGNQSQLSNIGTADNTGVQNTSVGAQSLKANVSGKMNTAIGANAANGTIGDYNTAIGGESLKNNPDQVIYNNNTAIGYNAASRLSGSLNTAIGAESLKASTAGVNNVAIGYQALSVSADGSTNNGSNNTIIGCQAQLNADAAATTWTSNQNTVIGAGARVNSGLTNSIAIGYQAIATASNTIRLGNSSVSEIYGGNTAAGTGANFRGKAFLINSDARIKKDIVNSKYGLATILKLRPVDYHLINDVKQEPQIGFIAQEVKAVVPELVTGKEGDLAKGEILGVNYAGLAPILTKAIQELKKENELQQIEINQLKELVKNLINKK